jgi:hypothetical protein
MNAVEIKEVILALAEQPFDAAELFRTCSCEPSARCISPSFLPVRVAKTLAGPESTVVTVGLSVFFVVPQF